MLLALLQVLLILISPFASAQLPTVNLTVDDSDASEVGQDPGSFILTRSNDGVIAAALVVRVDVGNSTATLGTDYDDSPNLYGRNGSQYSVQIPADTLSVTLTITPVVDAIVEGDETVVFSLVESNNDTYIVGPNVSGQLTIADSAPVVSLIVDDSDASEVGPNPGSFILTRSNDGVISAALAVRVDVVGSTAALGVDYANPGFYTRVGTQYWVQIPADTLSVTLTITPVVDAIVEGGESVVFSLVESNNDTYIVGPNAGDQLTIADSAPVVSLTVDDSVASEVGQDPGTFILTRSNDGVIAAALVVRVDVIGSTAAYGTDYDSSPNLYGRIGTQYWVQIPADTLSVPLTITPVVDAIVEGDETVVFSLVESNNSTYTVGDPAKAEITLKDFVGGIFKDSFENP